MKKVALPVLAKSLSPHFGQCEKFVIFTINNQVVKKEEWFAAPDHYPGKVAEWLLEKKVTHVLVASIGFTAIKALEKKNIIVIDGIKLKDPKALIREFVRGSLEIEGNLCNH